MMLKQGYHRTLQHSRRKQDCIRLSFMAACMQVGSELELMSKDERELAASRAELAALLTQQRSVQAATVQSQPSTSDAQHGVQVHSLKSPMPYTAASHHTVLHHISRGQCRRVHHEHPKILRLGGPTPCQAI